jgi:hypothetical protein
VGALYRLSVVSDMVPERNSFDGRQGPQVERQGVPTGPIPDTAGRYMLLSGPNRPEWHYGQQFHHDTEAEDGPAVMVACRPVGLMVMVWSGPFRSPNNDAPNAAVCPRCTTLATAKGGA